ncbi:hypothetical protein [Apilactobacillus timberlakei]|uniref:hypothetical protein n=1 Tax=Apilactobacillus timberlakei TaxID=2008380 RepID=UPI001126C824|nr:hypothetical protein [Apilactobacillus timberlakei]TPR12152.1 hypothetical protein DYZ97_07605 [Apilactobacillus timberlakei]
MKFIKRFLMLFVSILSFFIFFNTASFGQNQNTMNDLTNNTYSISVTSYVDRDNKNSFINLNNLNKDGIKIIKEESDVSNNLKTFNETNLKLHDKLIQKLPSGNIRLNSLKTLRYDDLIGQNFYVKVKNNISSNRLKKILSNNFKMKASNIKINSYNSSYKYQAYPNHIQIIFILIFSIFLLLIVYIYEYFLSYKELNMYLLFGYSKWNILMKYVIVTLKQLITPIFSILAMMIYCYLMFRSTNSFLIINIGIYTLKFLLITIIISLIIFSLLISLFSPDEKKIKGKYPFKSIIIFNHIIKAILIVSLVLVSQSILPQIKNTATNIINRNQTMSLLDGYKNIPLMPSMQAINFEDNHPNQFIKYNQKFFGHLYDKKIIMFAPSNSTRIQLLKKGKTAKNNVTSNIVYVSPEYLNNMDIKGNSDKKIKMNGSEKNGLVLLPNEYSNKSKGIKYIINKQHKDDIKDIYLEGASKTQSIYSSSPKLKYMFIKNNQHITKFYDYYSGLKNPILIVVPKSFITYPYSVYSANITGVSDTYFFKASNNDTNKIIDKSKLRSEYPKIITAQKRVNDNLKDSMITTSIEGTIGITLIISFIIVSVFSIWIYLIANKKLLLTKKIYGYKPKDIFSYKLLFISLFWIIIFSYEMFSYVDIFNYFYLLMGSIDFAINIFLIKIYFNKLRRK